MPEKLVIMCTHGPEDPERATIPFVMATAAQASDVEVVMGLQASAVLLARQGVAATITADAFPPLSDLVDAYVEAGGTLFLCGPCVKSRQLTPDQLIAGATVINAATFVTHFTSATNVLVY
ncbi:MAG: DsrE family protein [Anaerolineae bacterium]